MERLSTVIADASTAGGQVVVSGEPGVGKSSLLRAAGQIARRAGRRVLAIRPTEFDPAAYRGRNQVERGFNRRKHWRGPATRYDELGAHFQATLDLIETLDWLRAVPAGLDLRDKT